MSHLILKKVAYKVIADVGLPQIFHRTLFRNSITILMYHAVVSAPLTIRDWCFLPVTSFKEQMKYVKDNFRVISLYDAITAIQKGEMKDPSLVVTFDDGFYNNYSIAYPILLEMELPATIFLVTNLVDTDDTVWFCKLIRAISVTNNEFLDWKGRRYILESQNERELASAEIQEKLKEFSHLELLSELRKIIYALGDDPERSLEANSPFRILNRHSIKEMSRSGLIEFGAHTHSHAILSFLLPEDCKKEIINSINTVEDLTGKKCQLFSYPNGRLKDYDSESIEMLQSCGVLAGVTTISGPNNKFTPSLQLRRYGIGADMDFDKFKCLSHHFQLRIKNAVYD